MASRFRSKISYWILIPVVLLHLGIILFPMVGGAPVVAILSVAGITITVLAFTLHIFFGITYQITDEDQLLIKCGFLYNWNVNISAIKAISKTRNPISAPAASLDRIELKYGNWDSVIISPKNRSLFINQLLKINPQIQIKI